MMATLRDRIDRFFGRGSASTSVPIMDGPLQPDNRIEDAPVLAAAPGLDNLLAVDGVLYLSSGPALMTYDPVRETLVEAARFEQAITCLAGDGGQGLAIGLDGRGIVIRGGRHDGVKIEKLGNDAYLCPTAALFLDEDRLAVAAGSAARPAAEWKHDLMALGRSGSVHIVDLATGRQTPVAGSLGFPYGLARGEGDFILITEAWRHRLLRWRAGSPLETVLESLPGYPARIVAATGGGYWLTLFAPRNQLVEFVLRERDYCRRMMDEVAPDFWVAPALSGVDLIREPLQGGGVRQMGILKPWAPARSYGLAVRLNAACQPVDSWHSRADGKRHGITSICEYGGALLVGSKGAGAALSLPLNQMEEERAA